MKIKSLLLVAAISPAMVTFGQNAFLYNQGQMAVKGTDPSQTVLYINGDFVSGSSADVSRTSDITMVDSRAVLTGDFKHNALAPNSTVFNASSENAVFELRGTAAQRITTDGTTFANIPKKIDSYISFPTLEINNPNGVTLDQALGVQTTDLDLTAGTLVLGSERITDANFNRYFDDKLDAGGSNPDERTVLAHLKIDGVANYTDAANPAERGFVEVSVPLDPSGSYNSRPNSYGSIVGMGSPFKNLGFDYFTWNFVLAPDVNSYFGSEQLNDPNLHFVPGKGYLVGNELRGTDFTRYSDMGEFVTQTEEAFNARSKGGYIFNRFKFQDNINNLKGLYSPTNTAFTADERLNASDNTPITMTLMQGYNYLSNPFTTPLNIEPLLDGSATAIPGWGVSSGTTLDRNIYNAAWIVNGSARASAYLDMNNGTAILAPGRMQVDMSFYVASNVGGSYTDPDGNTLTLVPPLQMFVIYSNNDNVQITIPKSAQAMGANNFIRNAQHKYDDFVFEIKDKQTQTSDRASVVLRSKIDQITNATYSDIPRINAFVDNRVEKQNTQEVEQSVSSRLYTKSETGEPLSIKVLTYTPNVDSKISTPLYVTPSLVDQEVVIRGYRLESLTNFEAVILVDNLLGKEVLMTPETEYETTIKSTDSPDRFSLVFARGVDGIEDEITDTSKSISSYYANGTLTVTGFDETDFGSTLTVYDLQGRLVKQTKVDDFTVTVSDNFAPGAFIVKVVGNNSYVAKFLVK